MKLIFVDLHFPDTGYHINILFPFALKLLWFNFIFIHVLSVCRYYNEPPLRRGFNLITGENFSQSKAMFEAICVDLKRSGMGNVAHKPVIEEEDLQRIRSYFSSWEINNVILLQKVWLDLMLHCCRRGREGLRDLTKDSYSVDKDGNGTKFIVKLQAQPPEPLVSL